MKPNNRWALLGATTLMTFGTIAGPLVNEVEASTKGRRNTAIAAGAATVYGLIKGNKTLAIAGGLCPAYADTRDRDAKNSERRQTLGQVIGDIPV